MKPRHQASVAGSLTTALLSGLSAGLLQHLRDENSASPCPDEDRWPRILAAAGSGFVTGGLLSEIEDPTTKAVTSGLIGLAAAGLSHSCPNESLAKPILSSVAGATLWPAASAIYQAFETQAPKLLPGASTAKQRIFISHSWNHYADHRRLLDGLRGLGHTIYDHSVPIFDPLKVESAKELLEGLKRQIQGVSVFLLMARPGVERHPWVQAEIKIARELDKPIIAVRPHGKAGVQMLNSLEAVVSDKVGWNLPAISRRLHSLNSSSSTKVAK